MEECLSLKGVDNMDEFGEIVIIDTNGSTVLND